MKLLNLLSKNKLCIWLPCKKAGNVDVGGQNEFYLFAHKLMPLKKSLHENGYQLDIETLCS